MTSPFGSAMLLFPATSRQQIIQVVSAGPAVGKFCVIALGQNNWNRAGSNWATLVAGWATAILPAAKTEVTPRTYCRNRAEPIIDAALPCHRVSPPYVPSDRRGRETGDNPALF